MGDGQKGSYDVKDGQKGQLGRSEMIKKANYDVRYGKRAECVIRFGEKSSLDLEILSKRLIMT